MAGEERKPEPLELPVGPKQEGAAEPTGVGEFTSKPPTRLTLQLQKQQLQSNLENARREARQALIRNIQNLRGRPLLVYYSHNLLTEQEVKNFYQLFAGVERVPAIDLFLLSYGGIATEAYKMARMLHEHADHVGVLVPYKAKSAATLLALAGDEIIMGPASELGPIDPQFRTRVGEETRYLPALAIKEGLEFFEKRIAENPDLLPLYYQITKSLDPLLVGSYVREIESAKQYALRLLNAHMFKNNAHAAQNAAENLTTNYYSHGFTIDRKLARDEIGLNVVDAPVPLWESMWDLHTHFDLFFEENPRIGAIFQSANAEFHVFSDRAQATS
jgi:hypothetical protein